jgi:O-acetyl-ADP-ribose deacetylase (regulator of RNase III)
MSLRIALADLNPEMVRAWRRAFEGEPEVTVVQGSLLAQPTRAWVSPTNAGGQMNGGVDAAIRAHLGGGLQARVRHEVVDRYGGCMPVGHAICVPTGRDLPAFVVLTPTMFGSSEHIDEATDVALACGAALHAIRVHNVEGSVPIESVAMPGLGAGTGRVPADIGAELMWAAYRLVREQAFADFASLRAAFQAEFGELAPAAAAKALRAARLAG